jgi:hypothetical protein
MYGYEGTEDINPNLDKIIKGILLLTMLTMVALSLYSIKT